MKPMAALICLFSIILISPISSFAATDEQFMHDSLARGYLAAAEGNREKSEKSFKKAFEYAKKISSWSGLIDAGCGILVLGKHEDAMRFFNCAEQIIEKNKDWRGEIALAYAYLSSRADSGNRAILAFENAKLYALEKRDWRGLLESSKGFLKIGLEDKSYESLNLAYEMAKESKSLDGLTELARYYKEAGQTDKSQEAIQLSISFKKEHEQAKLAPLDWKPLGETIAGPETISSATQARERETADREIESSYRYLQDMAKKEKENKEYYLYYNYYYDYPYYYSWSCSDFSDVPDDWLCDWGSYYLSHYSYSNGFYFFTGW